MSRIRTVKPEFCESESVGRLSLGARLLFIQLFTIVDDAGRCRAAPQFLVSRLYPYDDPVEIKAQIDGWLGELDTEQCVRGYEVNGSHYLEIVNWLKHQKIDHKTPSKLPAFENGTPTDFAKAREDFAKSRETVAPDLDLDLDQEGKGEEHMVAAATADGDGNVVEQEVIDLGFERFKAAFPKRDGANPWTPAKKAWDKAIREGARPAEIIAGAEHYAIVVAKIDDRQKICRASTFLNEKRGPDRNESIRGKRDPVFDALAEGFAEREARGWRRPEVSL
jgi:hypothetical protein